MVIAESMGGPMKARTAIARTAHQVRLTVGWGLMTVLACVALSACSTSGTSSPPAVFSPAVTGSPTTSGSPSASASASESPSEPSTQSPTPDQTPSPVPTITYTYTYYPSGAPITGGGGTAGFQDAGLAVLGGVAIVAGLGTIAYRHRMTRNR
jgi:hypothetical protein